MFMEAYREAFGVLLKKPFVLWGLSLMSGLISIITSIFCLGLPALGIAIGYLITCGMAKVYLDGLDGKDVQAEQLFAGFSKHCFRIAGGMAWSALWSLIWSLVPIVGPILGIIKGYSYRFVPYILITQPEVSATQALKISMQLTNGIKGQMFLADLCLGAGIFVLFLVLTIIGIIPVLGGLIMFAAIVILIAFLPIFQGLYQAYFYAAKVRSF